MKVNDRGNIKWTSIMIPEHIQMLNNMWKQQEYKKKPELDDQQSEEINMKIHLAIHSNLVVVITYYESNDYKVLTGKLKKIDVYNQYVIMDEGNTIHLNDILEVEIR